MAKDIIYFDYAAATPMDAAVFQAMEPFFTEQFFNPSATYAAGRAVKQELEAARARVAGVLGARPSEIIFTAGGTEANNLAIHGVMRGNPDAHCIVSAIEHDSVLAPAEGYDHSILPVETQGRVQVDALRGLVTDKTVLISVMQANNEVGTIQPLRQLVQQVKEIRTERRKKGNLTPLYIHTDACQAANYLDIHVARLGVDMMTLNGGKIYGPKQSGVLFVASHVQLSPLILGGGQERGMRSGTENVAQAVGLSVALEHVQAIKHESAKHVQAVQTQFIRLITERFPEVSINGSLKQRLPNNVHVTFPGQDNERLLFALDERGVLAAAGSACSASNEEPSHVLRAMGVTEAEARASLRFTLGRHTTMEQIDSAVDALAESMQQ